MKKEFLFIALLVCSLHLNAQGDIGKNGASNAGFRMGPTLSVDLNLNPERFALDEATGYEANYDHFNYSIGLLMEYKMEGHFSFTSGITYSNKSFTGTYYCDLCDFGTPSLPEKVKLGYLEIPMGGRYYFNTKGIWPYGEVGLVNQFVLIAENENPQNRSNASTLEGTYLMSGKLGAGASIKAKPTIWVQFGIEYLHGFINLERGPDYNAKTLGFKIAVLKAL